MLEPPKYGSSALNPDTSDAARIEICGTETLPEGTGATCRRKLRRGQKRSFG